VILGSLEAPRDLDLAAFDMERELSRRVEEYESRLARRRKPMRDCMLLVHTEILQIPLRRYAQRLGLSYEAVKKRRQRLLAQINSLSPSDHSRGLRIDEGGFA
jgi:hypothetical protein